MADEPQNEDKTIEEDSAPQEVEGQQLEEKPKPFEGEYDPQRARTLIDKLRDENAELKKQKDAPKEDPEKDAPKEDPEKDAPKEDPEKDALAVENLQLRVALTLGIPTKLATRLRGSTEEELIEDAADLMDTVSPRKEEPKSQQPRPRLKGGSQPEVEPELSADDIVKAAMSRN